MKTRFLFLLLAVMGLSFVSCSDDDDDAPAPVVPDAIVKAFNAKYPAAKGVKREKEAGGYYTAEWREVTNGPEYEAWYSGSNTTATWAMTDTDYGKDFFLVPDNDLNVSFNKTEYRQLTVDGINLYEYPDASKNVYAIEVEQPNQPDLLLLFGTGQGCPFIKAITDNFNDITPDIDFYL